MIEKTLRTSKGNELKVTANSVGSIAHFNDPENHIDTILKQINEERMYDPIFAGRTDMTVLDLGANVGLFSLYAADSCKRIVAVEAVPTTYMIMNELTAEQPVIEAQQYAISNANADVSFFLNENSTTNSLVNRRGEEITVPGITLESLLTTCNLNEVDFVKCDIEGSEMISLTEATLAPVVDKINFWFVEVHQTNSDEQPWPGNLGVNREVLGAMLKNFGYAVEPVIHDQLYAYK